MLTLASATIENVYYRDWDCIQIVAVIVAALFAGIWFVVKRDHSEGRKAVLHIKQEIATMFLDTVILETQRLVRMVDKHLPDALSQVRMEHPRPSRFDYLCASLKELTEDELETNRKKFGAIIKDSFAGILEAEVDRLLKAAGPEGQATFGYSENPSGLRFGLEGQTGLKLTFLARQIVRAERHEKWYHVSHTVAMIAFVLAALSGIAFVVFGFSVKTSWGNCATAGSFYGLMFLGTLGLLGLLIFARCEANLLWLAHKCEEDPGFRKEFERWKGREA